MAREFFVEVEVRRYDAGDQPGTAIECQVLDRPLNEDQEPILKCDVI
jgi:hypothetical protein